MKFLRYIAIAVIIPIVLWSCQGQDAHQNSVTILLDTNSSVPEHSAVYISGNFEGWKGGNENFVLEKNGEFYETTLTDTLGNLEFKFTLGNWDTVEKDENGNDIKNRTYQFSKPNDTLLVTVESWGDQEKKNLVLPKNIQILNDSLYIPQLDRYRRIWVYTPSNYEDSNKKYPVVYMHDGQNLFMEQTSGFGEWKADETLDALSKYHDLEVIAVGIDHGKEFRTSELSPFKYDYAEKPEGLAYLDFIVNTLKPKIDSTYRTKPDRTNTAMIGASLGGLISHYAGFKHKDIFGKIGAFSPSYWISDSIYNFTKSNNLKLYLLAGTEEGYSLLPDTQKMRDALLENGFGHENLYYKEVEGGKHNETFWSGSFAEAICWLFDQPIPEINPILKDMQPQPQPEIQRIKDFPSKYIKSRPIDVWLPENYSDENKYSVLYMHDGQMLFDSTTTWNKQEWKVDEWATQLMNGNRVEDFIVVAIHNIAELRWQDLFPQKAYNDLSASEKKLAKDINGSQNFSLNGDNYLRFLVTELKPFIDSNFSTKSERENTFVMGSSMGGLMSMYAVSEYPEVFGGAACLSTHWVGTQPIDDNPFPEAIFSYMEEHLPQAGKHKLYFDYGNKTLDEHYPQYAPRVDEILKQKGFTDKDAKNLFFEGTNHSENAWNKRLDKPLVFLFKTDFEKE